MVVPLLSSFGLCVSRHMVDAVASVSVLLCLDVSVSSVLPPFYL